VVGDFLAFGWACHRVATCLLDSLGAAHPFLALSYVVVRVCAEMEEFFYVCVCAVVMSCRTLLCEIVTSSLMTRHH
jgi:hypothetical protein